MIPVPLIVGLLGLVVLFFALRAMGEEGEEGSEEGSYPDGTRPEGVCYKVWVSMHVLSGTRYGGTSYAWNVTRTANGLRISENEVRECYPESFWNDVHDAQRRRILAAGEAEFHVSPDLILEGWRELLATNPELRAKPLSGGTLATVANLLAVGIADVTGRAVPFTTLDRSYDRWKRYIRTVIGDTP